MKAYLETTIFNRYLEEAREQSNETKLLFDEIASENIEAFTSTLLLNELENAPEVSRMRILNLISNYKITVLAVHEAAFELADTYLETGIISSRFRMDALHIAMSVIYGMDCIISLDFRQINKWAVKAEIEAIHRMKGFGRLFICTPGEVIYD
jgi:predicted thioesterase